MFRQLYLGKVLGIGSVVLLLAATVHLWTAERQRVLQAVYPLEASYTTWQTRCSEAAPQWLERMLDYVIERRGSLANQIAYITPDGTLHHCESGWVAGTFSSPEITASTRFRFASLTKLVTVDAVLQEISEGRLALDQRLVDLLPEIKPSDPRVAKITIRHLLRHRAGFDRLKTPDVMFTHRLKPWCPYNIDVLADIQLDFDPDSKSSYSNIGYCLLGVILERTTGKAYRALMEERYSLRDRGMLFVDGPYTQDEVRYDFRNSPFYVGNYYRFFDFSALSSAAGLSGNAVELAHLLRELRERKPLNVFSADVGDCRKAYSLDCYGFALKIYEGAGSTLMLGVQEGTLVGMNSAAVLDSHGGVTVWLGGGMPKKGPGKESSLYAHFYQWLADYYAQP
ncbi:MULTISPECIES: serine hydrolase [unclassified Pseudomonas]|uniref:serine hydrolase domain-containing protein n=1 Tax=unclassified Pseudomonas TaxID=196821 RepID=UPI002447554E|nr:MULTISPECIES: serine hydrolase [unclassified Pseudomonas]MDH0893500.1 beta-lactamase family protein [Pseudomonas sp. GD03875]MDH1063807.1 beta-lactamase family protein [Pseudomonas sp. GD03985]